MTTAAIVWLGIYASCVVLANWALSRWGFVPVGFGLAAPAGVFFAGLSFTARDMLRETSNRWLPFLGIAIGVALSFLIEDIAEIALASAVAFGISETLDALVYEPLRKRGRVLALGVSNVVGFVADSAIFLWLAFGSLTFIEGQLLGKAYMTVVAVLLLAWWRKWRAE